MNIIKHLAHRSWEIHIGKGQPYTRRNQLKLIDYFISRIKFYANGGKLNTSNAKEVTENILNKK